MPNRLAAESSPYLRQHAHNPVDWLPWGPEAFARSKAEDKPILLSIGYSACHWCHVMERESFEDEGIAALMNAGFIPVKVDREERPDVDNLYQTAVMLLRRGGGWPLTAVLLPDGRPFFVGTYFPPVGRGGMPGFGELLGKLRHVWETQREKVEEAAGNLSQDVLRVQAPEPGALPDGERVAAAAAWLTARIDPVWGGLGQAPKFPSPSNLEVLLRGGLRGDTTALDALLLTLRKMDEGGIHDQLGGGFHRYSTDREWLVPHFEKMLYDNAQLVPLYAHAWRITADAGFLRVVRRTLDYLLREMRSPDGLFYAATDADSEGEEGRYFVWTAAEVRSVLADDTLAEAFLTTFDVRPGGNWEGTSILCRPRGWAEVAAELGVAEAELRRRVDVASERLYAHRAGRVPPLRDDKLIVAWNAMTIVAFVEGYAVTGDPRHREAARQAGDTLLRTLMRDGALQHSRCGEDVKGPGLLDDHAALGEALLRLHELDGDARWLDAARALAEALGRFEDGAGGHFQTPRDGEALFARPRDTHDSAVPSGSAMAASFLLRLWAHTGEARWRDAVAASLTAHGALIEKNPYGTGHFHAVLDSFTHGFVEVVLGGEGPERVAMEAALARRAGVDRIVLDLAHLRLDHPAASGRIATGPTAWVCRGTTCSLPVTTADALVGLLA